ncbi:MAG: hypothetical protein DRR42_15140 [Gammaproteobacteria bacterium]|nr:MAG: hypothetical protein DRR42_15140 [Gammaproteobacteria bacterium]
MIHVLTIHWHSDAWIDIQLKYLNKFIEEPFRVYAFLNNVPNTESHRNKFYYTSIENIKSHPIKLNLLADIASFAAEDGRDYLLFLDGDAFPISSITKFKNKTFCDHKLAAIQRTENNGDIQPHPCFCMTTVDFWNQIKGDWKAGEVVWKDTFGKEVGDVGGQMLKILENENWYKLNRSNHHDLHTLLFGIYDELIYHHCAAFRRPGTRVDQNQVNDYEDRLLKFRKAKQYMPRWLARKLFSPLKYELKKNQKNSDEIYRSIQDDFYFYKKLETKHD